jgi:hypothetical protein
MQCSFPATGIGSLCWRGDDLIDWVGGGRALALDGTEQPASVGYAYRFDAATASRDGRFAVIYERLGTKGLVLKDGKILREIDRSFYHANAYEYPVALFHEPEGRLLLAHCPRGYNRIELEDGGPPGSAPDKIRACYQSQDRQGARPHHPGKAARHRRRGDSMRRREFIVGLRGTNPAELPVQAPTKYQTTLNLNTAKALGLTIPETLLATADEVIQ